MLRSTLLVCGALALADTATAVSATALDATTFSIRQSGASKIVTIQDPKDATTLMAFVLTPRNGVAASQDAVKAAIGASPWSTVNTVHFFTPLQRVAVMSTTILPWFESMGIMGTVKAVSSASTVYSTCLRTSLADGTAVDTTDSTGWGTNMTVLADAKLDAIFCDAGWGCPGTAVDVPLRDFQEKSAFAVADYALLLSQFFDVPSESAASASLASLRTRYACASKAASDAKTVRASKDKSARTPRLLWAYTYGGYWYMPAQCEGKWYCPLVRDAGADLITSNSSADANAYPAYGGLSTAEFAPFLAQADVWVYANDNFETKVRPSLEGSAGADPALASLLAACPAVQNKRVYDLLRRSINSWFEERPANPDALLQDLSAVVGPDNNALLLASGPAHSRVWLRSISSEVAVSTMPTLTQTQRDACKAAPALNTAILETSRLSTGCASYLIDSNGLPVQPRPELNTSVIAIVLGVVGGIMLLTGAVAVIISFRRKQAGAGIASSAAPKSLTGLNADGAAV